MPHVKRRTDGRAPTPHNPLASQRATVTGQRRDTDQRRDLFAVQAAELRHVGKQRAAHHRTHAWHRSQEILFRAPDRAALDRVVEIAIDLGDATLEPPDVIRETLPDRRCRVLEPILSAISSRCCRRCA